MGGSDASRVATDRAARKTHRSRRRTVDAILVLSMVCAYVNGISWKGVLKTACGVWSVAATHSPLCFRART